MQERIAELEGDSVSTTTVVREFTDEASEEAMDELRELLYKPPLKVSDQRILEGVLFDSTNYYHPGFTVVDDLGLHLPCTGTNPPNWTETRGTYTIPLATDSVVFSPPSLMSHQHKMSVATYVHDEAASITYEAIKDFMSECDGTFHQSINACEWRVNEITVPEEYKPIVFFDVQAGQEITTAPEGVEQDWWDEHADTFFLVPELNDLPPKDTRWG